MTKTVVLAIVAAFVLAPAGIAATHQGDTYFTLDGMWQRMSPRNGDSVKATLVGAGVESFVTKEISVGPKFVGIWSDYFNLYGFGVDGKYHFNTDSTIVPYVGGQANYVRANLKDFGFLDSGSTVSGLMYGPLVGVKMFMTDNTVLFVEYQYNRFTSDLKDNLKDQHAILFGVAFKFN